MGRLMAVLLLFLSSVFSSTLAQSCQWKNGQDATDYVVCNPAAAQSSCCVQGEACIGDGYCFGNWGMVYRGACSGGWGNDTACPQACNDAGMDGGWANMVQCPSITARPGAISWWCGHPEDVSPCDEDGTNSNPTRAQIFTLEINVMRPQAIMPLPSQNFTGCAVSPENPYSIERQIENATQCDTSTGDSSSGDSSSGSSGSCDSANTATNIEKTCPKGVQIGEGVAIGVLALIALAMLGWAFYERRQKNRLLAGTGQQQQQQHHHDASMRYTSSEPKYQSLYPPATSEMDSVGNARRSHAHEMQS